MSLPGSAGGRLSAQDALFVYLEKKEMPLHIASISTFDGPIPYKRLMAWVESKLPLIPRYRQRLAFPPYYIGHPTWEFDPDFDIRHHVFETRLNKGTDEELQDRAGQVLTDIMDRSRPLWDLTLVNGLKGGRCAIIARVHHCLVDGVAGVGLMNVLLDKTPKIHRLPKKQAFEPPALPDQATRVVNAISDAIEDFGKRMIQAQAGAVKVAQSIVGDLAGNSLEQLARVVPELFVMIDRLPINQPVRGPRKIAWASFPLAEFKAIRAAAGVKLNDIGLAMIAAAVRRYSELHGQSMKHRVLRTMVPVNLRTDPENPGVGNDISVMPVNIPLDVTDPVELLRSVHNTTETMKRLHVAELIALGGVFLGGIPAPLRAAFLLLGNVLPLPPWNMVCTNVPGPQFPLYVLGREMLTYYPYVPIGNDMAVNCAIESYNGNLYFNFTGDALVAPDLGRIRDFLVEAYNDLREATGKPRTSRKKSAPVSGDTSAVETQPESVVPPNAIEEAVAAEA
jgi:diacylglycerol O-acyltransferase